MTLTLCFYTTTQREGRFGGGRRSPAWTSWPHPAANTVILAPVPILPGKTLEISLGGLTVLLTGGAGYQRSRRRKAGKAA
jgi:hypothetical protein